MINDHLNLRFEVVRYTGAYYPVLCAQRSDSCGLVSANAFSTRVTLLNGHVGEIYMAFAREHRPPGFASNNKFALAVDSLTNWSTVLCQPHQPERVYYGLYGGETQAEYDVSARKEFIFV